MSSISELIKSSRKIVIKIGSNVLSNDKGMANIEFIESITEQITGLRKQDKQIMIVSSGAGICGVGAMHMWARKGDINYKQALCAIGQVELMNAYKHCFARKDIHVGQLLITGEDFEDHNRSLNIRNTLFTLIDEGVVPIINENDTVSIEQISIGDNDTLGALTANLWNADLFIILSDIDGVYDKNPKMHKDAKLIKEVTESDKLMDKIETEGTNSFGTGGIITKIKAAVMVNSYGIPMLLANGKNKNVLNDLMEEKAEGTVFVPYSRI